MYKIDLSGPIFFISGEAENCNKGQKLEIIVLAVRNNTTTHKAPSPTPSALSPSPAANPAAASPNVESPKAESPNIGTSPEHSSVVQAPAPAPSAAAGVGGGSVGLVMGLSLVLGLVSGLV